MKPEVAIVLALLLLIISPFIGLPFVIASIALLVFTLFVIAVT